MAEIFLPEGFLRARLNNLLTTIYEAPEFGNPLCLSRCLWNRMSTVGRISVVWNPHGYLSYKDSP